MARPVWPFDISDRPLRDNVGYQPMANMESFSVDGGEGFEITAPVAAEAPLRMSPTYPMSNEKFARWLVWWREETKSGTIPFELRDPYERVPYFWRLQSGQQIGVDKTYPNEVRVRLPVQRVP
jgi:hypothetical protein